MTALKEEMSSKHTNSSGVGSDLHELGNITGKLANDAVNMAHDNFSAYYEKGVKKAKELERNFEGQIKANPIRSLLIVAGLGLVVGTIWNRRLSRQKNMLLAGK